MSNTDDMLKALVDIRDSLKSMQRNSRASFSSDFGNVNMDAAKSLARSLEKAKEEVKSADEHMKDFVAGAEAAVKTFNDADSLMGKIKGSFKFIDDSTNKIFSRAAKKFGLDKVFKSVVNAKNATIGWFKALKKAETAAQKINIAIKGTLKAFMAVAAVIATITLGVFAIGAAITKSIIGAVTSLASATAKTVKFIFTLPTTIAKRAAELGNELRKELVEVIGQAVENTKELFDMASNGGSAFVRLGNIAKGSLLSFQSVNSTMTKLFGYGAAGAAKMVADVTKNIADMGLFADVFADSTTKSGKSIEFITKMTRGMAMQGDDLNYVVRESIKNGEHYFSTMTRMYEASDAASKEFGVNRKLLSKNFFQLRKDIVNFGHLSEPTLMSVAARATQMGVEMKDLAAVFNKFGTFEDAANSAALLSQTFGMNIDALQLIRAENPMEIVDMFRSAMHATGRSFDDLNRHEKSLMATHTGMSVESLKTVMNYRTMGKSFEEIKKIMNDQKPEERQIKAMKAIKSAVAEVQKTMDKKDFFTAFTDGLSKTLLYSKPLKKAYTDISKNMEDFYENGLKIDPAALAQISEPFTHILKEINSIFDKNIFAGVANQVINSIGSFVQDVIKGTEFNWDFLSSYWETRVENIFSLESLITGNGYFGKASKVFGKILGYITKAFTLVGPGIIKGIINTMHSVVDFIRGGGISSNLKDADVAAFLGFSKNTWLAIKEDLINKYNDLKIFLFGGRVTLASGVVDRVEGKLPLLGSKLADIFAKMIPWEYIGEKVGQVLIAAFKVVLPVIKNAAIVFAKTAAIVIGKLIGVDVEAKLKKASKEVDNVLKKLDVKAKQGGEAGRQAAIEAANIRSNRSSIEAGVAGQQLLGGVANKAYGLASTGGLTGVVDTLFGTNYTDQVGEFMSGGMNQLPLLNRLAVDTSSEQLTQELMDAGSLSRLDQNTSIANLGQLEAEVFNRNMALRSGTAEARGYSHIFGQYGAAGGDGELTLKEFKEYLVSQRKSASSQLDFEKNVLMPMQKYLQSDAGQQTITLEMDSRKVGEVLIDHIGRISQTPALNPGLRSVQTSNDRARLRGID